MRKILSLVLGLVLTAMLVAPAAALPAAPAQATGVVTDLNGRPLPGAEVEVYRLGAGLTAVLTADAGGAFRVAYGDPGSLWQLRVRADGYRTLETGWIDLSAHRYQALKLEPLLGDLQIALRSSSGKSLEGMARIVGADGQLVSEQRVEAGRLVQTGMLTGAYRVIATVPGYVAQAAPVTVAPNRTADLLFTLDAAGVVLSGEVTDAVTNQPLPGATVEAVGADGTIAGSGQSAAEGRFRLAMPQAAPGAYKLRVSAPGYRTAVTQPATLAAGQEHDWSGGDAVALQPLKGTVAGTLMNSAGAGYPAVDVVLLLKGYGEAAVVRTDRYGNFEFDDVAVGSGAEYRVSYWDSNGNAETPWTEITAGTRSEVVLQVPNQAIQPEGVAKLSGVVSATGGAPIAGAKVELFRGGAVAKSVMTAADGSFLINDVVATGDSGDKRIPYSVRVTKDGFVPAREFTIAGLVTTELLVQPQTRISLKAVMAPAANDLRGHVTDPDGHPLQGVQIRVAADGTSDFWSSTSDANGWYVLQDVPVRPAASYVLRVQGAGYLTPDPLDVTDSVTGSGSLPTVRLTPQTAVFTGQVAAPDGTPLAGVAVALRGPDGKVGAQATTDEAGLYRLTATVPKAGLMTLSAGQTGWTTAVAELAAPPAPGATFRRDLLILPNTATLEGQVLNGEGVPVAGAGVELLEEGRGVIASAETDAQGRYHFENVALDGPGWFWMRARTPVGSFGGSLTDQTELVPLLRLTPGEATVTDLLVNQP